MSVRANAGQYRHRVSIERPERSTDDHGESVEAYTKLDTVWANITPLTANEYVNGEQITQDVSHKIRMRYYDITPSDRIVYNNRIFNINQVMNTQERDRVTEILAKEDLNA